MQIMTDALVIKEMNVGESDRLVTLLTREYGVIKAFAAGAKNLKNKKAAATGLLSLSNMLLEKKNDTYKLREAAPIRVFFNAGDDIKKLALAQYFCELCLALAPAEAPAQEYMRLILNSLHFLTDNRKNQSLLKAVTELRLLVLSGYAPDLLSCTECGRFEDDTMYFDVQNGALYCGDCKPEQSLCALDRTNLNAMRHIVFSEFSKLYAFEIPEKSASELTKITERYLMAQAERKFYTLDFYNSIP